MVRKSLMERIIRATGFVCIAVLALVVPGCGNRYHDQVVGTWETNMPLNPKFVLAKDGTGTISVSAAGQNVSKAITWRLNGNNLIFKVDGKESGGLIKSIDDKTMILNDPDVKKDATWTRVKS